MKNKYYVIKRNENKEVYNPLKINKAIYKAAINGDKGEKESKLLASKISEEVDKKLMDYWEKGIGVTVETIQDLVENKLMEYHKFDIARKYIKYRLQHKKIRNLGKEEEKTFSLIDDYLDLSDWKVKENSNMKYSLQGLNNHISSEMTKTYWLDEIFSEEVRKSHLDGDIHLHDLGQLSAYCTGWDLEDLLKEGFSGVTQKIESSPPKHFDTALMQIVNFLYTVQGEVAGAVAFSNFDTYLAPFIHYDDLSYKEVKQAMQQFIYNMNVPTRVGFQSPFTNITMDLKPSPTLADQPVIINGEYQEKTYGEFQEEMDMINRAYAEVMMSGDRKGRIFSFPIPTYNITNDFDWDNENLKPVWEMTAKFGIPYFSNFISSDMDPDDVRSMCCRLRLDNTELKKRGGGLFGANPLTGAVGVGTINLARIGYEANDKKEFYKILEKRLELVKNALETRREVVEKLTDNGLFPYAKFFLRNVKQRFDKYWQNHFNAIGILGMNEGLLNLIGKDIGTKEGKEFAEDMMDYINNKAIEYQKDTGHFFNIEATPGESTTYRFATLDKEKYGDDIISANQEKVIKEDAEPYYTNSTKLPVDYTDDIFEELQLQDELEQKYTGGTVIHYFLGEESPDIEATKKLVKRSFENFGLPYISITPTFSICPVHGYLKGEHEFCPKCG